MAELLPNAVTHFDDNNGNPLAGGSVFFYIPGTSTFKSTYQDSAQSILNTNPVILNARGEALIWGSGVYRQVVYDNLGNLIWDQITEGPNSAILGNITDKKFVAGTDFTPGTTTVLTLPAAPGSVSNMWMFFDAAYQADDQIASLVGLTLTLTAPIPIGVQEVNVKIGATVAMGVPGNGTVGSAQLAPGAVLGSNINQVSTGQFFSGNGAQVNRFNDRVFVGGATVNDGAFPNVKADWLATYQAYFTTAGGTPPSVTTMMNVMGSATSPFGGEPLLSAGHTSTGTSTGANALGMQAYGIANNTAFGGDFAWGYYGEGHRAHEGTGNCYGMEICVVNLASVKSNTPYFSSTGSTIGLQIDSGCGFGTSVMPTVTSASSAMEIVDNAAGAAPFINGIIFQNGSVQDSFGNHAAIVFPQNYELLWYTPANLPSSFINGNVSTAANATGIMFTDNGLEIHNGSNQLMGLFPPVASPANYPQFAAAVAGSSPAITAQGTDTNINLQLSGKGTGLLQFGTYNSGSFSVAGYMPVLDSGGTLRRLLVG